MVRTRSGHDVFYTEASYGRAARKETTRRRQKRKLSARTNSVLGDSESGNATPQRTRTTRGQIQREQDLATPPSALSRVGATPPRKAERILRGRIPTCSDYGISRHFLFQGSGFFFCHACDLWDSLPPDQCKKSLRASVRLACTANHNSFSHPTTFRKDYCRREPIMSIAAMNNYSEDSTDSTTSTATTIEDDERREFDIEQEEDDAAPCVPSYRDDYSEHEEAAKKSTTSTSFLLQNLYESDSDVCDTARGGALSANNNSAALPEVNTSQQEVIRQLKEKVGMLQEWNLKLTREIKRMRIKESCADDEKKKQRAAQNAATTFQDELLVAINGVAERHNRRWSAYRTGAQIAKLIWNHQVFQPHLLKLARKYLRETVFTPFNILREMDLAGGTLSYEGIDVLRRVETSGVKRFRGSIIPSKSEIKRMAASVEWFARRYCPFSVKITRKGEAIEFNYAHALLCIMRAFHLDEIGKARSISIASSIDGASLSKNLSIIAGGVKITDLAARCPLTKRPLLDNPATMSAQSRNLCIPLKIMMGRETKETFTEFGSLFKFLDDLSHETSMPNEMEGFKPFSCMTNCDLSAQWKGLGKGGAAKVHTLPCTGCATESNALATPNPMPCIRWCHKHTDNPDWMCFHKPMATPERVASMKVEVRELLATLEGALDEIQAESQMTCFDVEISIPSQSSTCDPQSIHFCPTNAIQRQSYSRLITNELILRGLDVHGTLETRREKLLGALKGESTINRLSKEISHGNVREGAYFLLMQTLPCVLHMENRNGIKLLTMVFVEGLSNAKKKLLYTDVNAEGKRVSQYISDIEQLINTSILGTDDDPCQWMCPYDANKKELGPITMDNVRTRRVVDSLDAIVDLCVTDEIRKTLWTTSLNNYRIAMVLLRKREDFTNEMIATYQDHADKFYQAWVMLWQKEGITNYLHMIGSGHIADYLYKWKNLYRFSQQGWEAMNSLIKTFFFRRTSHGGGVKGDSKKSRLIPIARWLQRRLILLCRFHEDDIRQFAIDYPMPKNYRTQTASEEDIYD